MKYNFSNIIYNSFQWRRSQALLAALQKKKECREKRKEIVQQKIYTFAVLWVEGNFWYCFPLRFIATLLIWRGGTRRSPSHWLLSTWFTNLTRQALSSLSLLSAAHYKSSLAGKRYSINKPTPFRKVSWFSCVTRQKNRENLSRRWRKYRPGSS